MSPIPDASETISFDIIKAQDELKTSTTVIKVPEKPVVLGAWARAISERGEDGGTQTTIVAEEAMQALKQAIMTDSGNTQYETDWYVDANYSDNR